MLKIAFAFSINLWLPLAVAPLEAKELAKPVSTVSTTERLAAAGAVHLEDSRGQVNIEGWDQPQVEVAITKSGRLVEHAQVKSERRGDEIVISTQIPRHEGHDMDIEYKIKAPRDSKIVIDRAEGGIYVTGITGDIEASVRHGQITLSVPVGAAYQIDAQAKLGEVYSDFEGDDRRRHLVGHEFEGGAASTQHKMTLRVGIGDIVIMKAVSVP